MKIALVVLALLAAVFAIWQYQTRSAARSEEELARVMQLDPRKVEPSTRALLLLEMVPRLRDAKRDAVVKQLRGALEAIPRGLVLHRPTFPVETIRFSRDGFAVLWYGRTKDGSFAIEKWSLRAPKVRPFNTSGSNATFIDAAGTDIFFEDEPEKARPDHRIVISSDGGYLARVQAGFLSIWRVQQIAGGSTQVYPAYMAQVPNATTRLHCVAAADLCGFDAPGRFTLVDVKGHRVLRSISVDKTATIHLSPGGRFVGVGDPRGIALHEVGNGRKVRIDASSLALEDFAFSADEKSVVVVARDGVLHSYDAATGKPVGRSAVLRQEQWNGPARIETLADGRFVVWGGEKVRLVSADLSTVTARFDEGGEVAVVEANARGDRLAIARRGGPLTLWDISPKVFVPLPDAEMLATACGHVGRPLPAAEWATYFPSRKYAPRCQ